MSATSDVAPASATLVSASKDWSPETVLKIETVPGPGPDAMLTDLGASVRVSGRARFQATSVLLPVGPASLVGIEPTSIRLLRWEPEGWILIPESGYRDLTEEVWGIVDREGTYVAAGLPRDPVLRALLRALAVERGQGASRSADQARALTTRRLLTALEQTPAQALEELRELLAGAEAAAMDPALAHTVRRSTGGSVAPPPLPGDSTLPELLERLRQLEPPPGGLAEEVIFRVWSESGTLGILPTEAELPPALARDLQPLGLTELAQRQVQLEVGRAAAAPVPGIPPTAHWWMYHRDPLHSGVVSDSHISRATVAGLRLRANLNLGGPVVSVPAVVDNAIYVGIGNSRWARGGSGGSLFKIDLLSGAVLRSFTFHTPRLQGSRQGMAGVACTPAVVGGRVYFSGLDGKLYCLDAETLRPIWITDLRRADPLHNQPVTHPVAAEGWCSPLVINGRVFVGFGEGESSTWGFVYCLDALTGRVIWLFCTNLFPGFTDNAPNLIPRSLVGVWPLPTWFRAMPDPPTRGASVWSSFAFDPVSNRVIVGTGNVLPPQSLPQPHYALGVLSLDAETGANPRIFHPGQEDNYRPDDFDVDMAASPLVFARGGQRMVAIGCKNGSFYLLDADTLQPVARRQLLPRSGGNGGFPGDDGEPIAAIDPRVPGPDGEPLSTENFYGVFSSAVAHPKLERLYVGVGGFAYGIDSPGIDSASTAFLRCLDWNDLTDAWATVVGEDGVARYVASRPPMYTTPGEAGFASPVLVNDVVFMSTSRPGLYAFDAESGLALWRAPGMGPVVENSFTLGPAVYGDFVIVGSAHRGLLVYSL
jgi:outer membrane protein assembly factor BamB